MLSSIIKNNKHSLVAFVYLSLVSLPSWSAQKVALVIGNNSYLPEIGALPNPVNDAVAIDQKLKKMGFDTILLKNGTKSQMLDALDDFKEKLQSGSTAIFYYAGHGVEANGKNYLIPVDAKMPRNEDRYSDDFFDMREKAMQAMLYSSAENKILIIDACRDNPAAKKSRGIGGGGRGFARTGIDDMPNAGKVGLFFSTLSGTVASDGSNSRHSPFTAALLSHLDKPNLTWPELVGDVSEMVRQSTKGQQVWSEGGAELARFKLLPVAEVKPYVVATPAVPDAELVYWDSIKGSTNASDYAAYLQDYPRGRFAGLAKNRQQQYAPKPVEPSPAPVQLAQVQVRDKPTPQAEQLSQDEQLLAQGQWRDPKTNLIWMRCSVGQTWTGKTCIGEGKEMDWDDAMKVGNGFNYGGVTGWRLPNIEELKTIMIKGKAGYASAFFSRPESDTWGSYWSSSPVANDSSYAWFVGFYGRSGGNGAKTNNYYVRLVRSSQ
ncbi:MAG: caspase family protein [Pseudomonadales bacterium]|nr:caspase family protein [Pseudomonadales bacterium]